MLHELYHTWEANYGKWDMTEIQGVKNVERTAVNAENVFRKQLGFLGLFGMTSRATYNNDVDEHVNVYNPDFEKRFNDSKPGKND